MSSNSIHARKSRRIISYKVFAALCQTTIAFAQNSPELPQHPSNPKLAKTVKLTLGSTTVDNLMTALSEQTGLNIRAADYLRERKIIVQMDGVTAETVLNDIGELNEWTWSETIPDRIMVVRKRLHVAATADAIPRLIQAAIPKDVREYLAIETPTEDIAKHIAAHDDHAMLKVIIASGALARTVAVDQAGLLTSLPAGIIKGEPIPYAKLTEHQRRQLLVALVFPLFQQTNSQLLRGNGLPQVSNIKDAVIELNGVFMEARIMVNNGTGDTSIGFSAPFQSPAK